MSLVQYDSSSDSSDDETMAGSKLSVSTPTVSAKPGVSASISSFLPPPKNPNKNIQSKSQILGRATKNTVNAMIAHNSDGIVLPRSERKITSFVPSSVRNKARSTDVHNDAASLRKEPTEQVQQATTPLPVSSFSQVKSKGRLGIDNREQIGIRTLDVTAAEEQLIEPPKSTVQSEEPDDIKEFDMDSFYSENLELKARGELQENKRLFSVSNSKNQLSSLIKNAQQNEGILEEKFERNKRARKERENRYGF
jgi:hypothetical protein